MRGKQFAKLHISGKETDGTSTCMLHAGKTNFKRGEGMSLIHT